MTDKIGFSAANADDALQAKRGDPAVPRTMEAASLMESGSQRNSLFGLVDLLGYDMLAGGLFFSGWVTHPALPDEEPHDVTIHYRDGSSVNGRSRILFFPRNDVAADATGFLLFVIAPPGGDFFQLSLELGGLPRQIKLAQSIKPLTLSSLAQRLRVIVSLAKDGPLKREMERLLDGAPGPTVSGFIEAYGYSDLAAGWFIAGWISQPWAAGEPPADLLLSFEAGDVRGPTLATLFPRAELPEGAQGFVFFVGSQSGMLGRLSSMSWRAGVARHHNGRRERRRVRATIAMLDKAPQLTGAELTSRIRPCLALARRGATTDQLSNLLGRLPYNGEDTLDTLSPNVMLHLDLALGCGAEDVALSGWMLARTGAVQQIRLCSGQRRTRLDLDGAVRAERPDVLNNFAEHGFDDPLCGFLTYLPQALEPDARPYIEIETRTGKIAYRNVELSGLGGMAAIRKLLGLVDLRSMEIQLAFDHVLGPAVAALNTARLARPPAIQTIDYGKAPAHPIFSVIVPLHGRLDFAEYQMALFSAWPPNANVEFIYVLDDPPKRREAKLLFASIYERFQIPFRAILLDRNLGFAPANNIALQVARGDYIAFMNSDVFPKTPDWLERLSARLEDHTLGAVAPLLLYEDGSVQHRGMYYEKHPDYGDWYLCQHYDKGMRPSIPPGLSRPLAITGACIVMRRDLALQLGGFDEVYAIGDFEDSDLCFKLGKMGLGVAVDADVQLYHLERKSQAGSGDVWRANLTAYNAWQHQRRWAGTIATREAAPHG